MLRPVFVQAIRTPVMFKQMGGRPFCFWVVAVMATLMLAPPPVFAGSAEDEALIMGARAGRADIVTEALSRGADVNAADETRFTALMAAALGDNLAILNRLLAEGALTEPREARYGNTALAIAARHGNIDSLSALLNAGADANAAATRDGLTPLMQASASLDDRAPEVIAELLAAGAKINVADKEGWTAMHHAAARSTPSAVALLVDAGMDVNDPKTAKGVPALELAVIGGRTETVAALISFGADVNRPGTQTHTPLMRAARKGREEMVTLLAGVGAEVNLTASSDGTTALMWAANSGFLGIVRTLLAAGADPKIVAKDGWTALQAAEMMGDEGMIAAIVAAGG